MKTCTKCGVNKPIEGFAVKKGKLRTICKSCNNQYFYKWYEQNKDKQLKRVMSLKKKNRKEAQIFIVEYLKKNPCVDCGINDILVLEFDHVKGKVCDVSKLLKEGCTLARLQKEIALCEVRCCNCHRRKTLSRLKKHYRTDP